MDASPTERNECTASKPPFSTYGKCSSLPPEFQNPPNFRHRLVRIWTMVQNSLGVNTFKKLTGEIKLLCINNSKLRRKPERRQTPLRVLNGTPSQINTLNISSGLGLALMARPRLTPISRTR
jgi:hypothetical protein